MSKISRKPFSAPKGAVKKARFRDDDEEKPSSFEAELATMDYEDDDFFPDITEEHGEGPEQENISVKWSRTSPPSLNPQTDTLTFQQIEIDHYIGKPLPGMPGSKVGPSTLR
ncbi:DNA polymerase delta catalytic subunit [Polyergus mexicanus]|uniref:DNA polymerase delta catalytic subunit n=1 Tax=Polyergus mexicanus TaxID=615972 RepID=UPI0038B54AC4